MGMTYDAGALLAAEANRRDLWATIVDATVVVGAATRGDLVVTSDPEDLQRISAVASHLLSEQVQARHQLCVSSIVDGWRFDSE